MMMVTANAIGGAASRAAFRIASNGDSSERLSSKRCTGFSIITTAPTIFKNQSPQGSSEWHLRPKSCMPRKLINMEKALMSAVMIGQILSLWKADCRSFLQE